MYFNEKEETNIDHQFEDENKFSLKNLKPVHWIIAGIVLLVAIIVIVVVVILTKKDKYVIELVGEEKITITIGSQYIEPGYEVFDSADQNLKQKVKVSGKVDTSKVGTYEITYSVVNSRNKTITAKRYVIVKK